MLAMLSIAMTVATLLLSGCGSGATPVARATTTDSPTASSWLAGVGVRFAIPKGYRLLDEGALPPGTSIHTFSLRPSSQSATHTLPLYEIWIYDADEKLAKRFASTSPDLMLPSLKSSRQSLPSADVQLAVIRPLAGRDAFLLRTQQRHNLFQELDVTIDGGRLLSIFGTNSIDEISAGTQIATFSRIVDSLSFK
ncbi:MAG: hypothetical protein ACYDAK_13625 [Candidatus Limnocylindrales bacterium]